MDVEAIKGEIEQTLASKVSQDSKLHNIYLLVHSDARHIHWPMAAGRTDELLANPHQPFHTASVGKTFTSVILAMLIEKGLAAYNDPIAKYLPSDLLEGLHVYKGEDYSHEIQLQHLLSNTSGLPDFFRG